MSNKSIKLCSKRPYGTKIAFISGIGCQILAVGFFILSIIHYFILSKLLYGVSELLVAVFSYIIFRLNDIMYEWHKDAVISVCDFGVRYEYHAVTFSSPAIYIIKSVDRIERKKDKLIIYGKISYKNPTGKYASVIVKKCKISGHYSPETFDNIEQFIIENVASEQKE